MTLTIVIAVVAFLAMVLGEAWRVDVPGLVRDAPIAQATAIALAMATEWPADASPPGEGHWFTHLAGVGGPLFLAVLATVGVVAFRRAWEDLSKDVLRSATTVLVAGALARVPGPRGTSLFEWAADPADNAGLVALAMLLVAVVAVVAPVIGRSMARTVRDRVPFLPQLARDLGRHGLVSMATATTGVVMALALRVLGPVSFVLFLVPMAVLLPAVTRQRRIKAAQRQTIIALSSLTDHAGLTTPGHATRVAAIAVPVAREVGVDDADLQDVETAALLHDIGQVGLSRPIPGGATTEVSSRDQRRVATMGAAILSRTVSLSRLASVVADVGVQQHRAVERGDVTTTAKVVRVVSAYDDLTGRGTRLSGGSNARQALERIVRSTPHEFDPDSVRALLRYLERRGELTSADATDLREATVEPQPTTAT